MAKKINHLLAVQEYGNSVNRDDPQAVDDAVQWYFRRCADDDISAAVEGLALALGMTRRSLLDWLNGEHRQGSQQALTVKKAREIIGSLVVFSMNDGTLNPIAAIFNLTNNHGYEREASNAATTININMAATPQQLEQKYQDVIDADYQEQKQLGE